MSGIVVFGGTVEGRLIAEAFQNTELEIHMCVATEYGAAVLPSCSNLHIHAGRMDEAEMERFLEGLCVEYCLDATHPYAAAVTENIVRACQKTNLPYIRVLREEGKIGPAAEQEAVQVIYVNSAGEAAAFLEHTGGNILITTGSRELEAFTQITDYKSRCFARVLPTVSVVEKCKLLGFEGKNLIAMQGPFSEELNYWMLKQIGAVWLVTKNSGREGGYQEKCEAALRVGVNLLVIGRGKEPSDGNAGGERVLNLSEALCFLKKQYDFADQRKVYLIGMGPGDRSMLTGQAEECLKNCDVIIGAKRILEIWPKYREKPFYACYRKEEILSFLDEHTEYRRAVIAYSGDIGFYSGAKGMRQMLSGYEVHPVSGISSVSYFLNQLGISWDDAALASCHGQSTNLIPLIRRRKKVCALVGDEEFLKEECRELLKLHMDAVRITVGERLSYPQERIFRGTPSELQDRKIQALSVVLFENPEPERGRLAYGIPDSEFVRGKVPMTKKEIRILSLSQLMLTEDAVVYDIGAGTGSVSIEAAQTCEEGMVYAVEKNPEAVRLLHENQCKFGVGNMKIIEGEAPECLLELPAPTHVFIGGSSGKSIDIIRAVRKKNENARFVMNAATLETIAQIERIREAFPEYGDMEMIQVQVTRGKELGSYHMMSAENPVMIVSFGGGLNGK